MHFNADTPTVMFSASSALVGIVVLSFSLPPAIMTRLRLSTYETVPNPSTGTHWLTDDEVQRKLLSVRDSMHDPFQGAQTPEQ